MGDASLSKTVPPQESSAVPSNSFLWTQIFFLRVSLECCTFAFSKSPHLQLLPF